jgi:hypothetical protein
MNDDDTDSGGDFFVDLLKTVIALLLFMIFVTVIGSIVWGLT